MDRLQDRVIVITGGAKGQGAEEARRCAEEGARVVVADVLEDEGRAVAEEVDGAFHRLDVSVGADWEALVAAHRRVDGIGFDELEAAVRARHARLAEGEEELGGFYKHRRGGTPHITSPKVVLSHVNRKFYQAAESNVFVTLLYCVVDLTESTLTFSRAGHNPLLVYRPSEQMTVLHKPPGLGIGLDVSRHRFSWWR